MIAAGVLGFIALVLLLRFVFSGSTSKASTAAPVTAVASARPAPRRPGGTRSPRVDTPPSLDPTLRLDLLKESEETKYSGSARNIFTAAPEPMPTPVVPAIKEADKGPALPPQPPPPPPITLKFFGFASKPGEPKRVFLSQDGDVFIASEGDIVDRRYRILRINTTSVEVEDVLHNNRQSIPLTQG